MAYMFSYWIAISGTIKTRQDLRKMDIKLEKLATAPESIDRLENRVAIVDGKIGENPGDIPEFQKNMLDKISSYCAQNGLVLKDFPKIHSWQKNDYQFITGYANIEGPFIPLLKLLYQLETSHTSGRIVSVTFASIEDHRIKKTRLTMSVYVQTIKQISNVQPQ
jgi:hypothetical protein